MDGQALLLNASFQPLQIVHWQKAIQLLFAGKAEVVEESTREIRSVSVTLRIPLVVRLVRYVPQRTKRELTRFSRINIFTRDFFTCQYCGSNESANALTLDHVVPIVKGGPKTWENIVTSCRPCNQLKGGRTPDEASMKLLKLPKRPLWLPFIGTNIHLGKTPEYLRRVIGNYLAGFIAST